MGKIDNGRRVGCTAGLRGNQKPLRHILVVDDDTKASWSYNSLGNWGKQFERIDHLHRHLSVGGNKIRKQIIRIGIVVQVRISCLQVL